MKRYYDKKHREMEYGVGEYVYLKLQSYRQVSVIKRAWPKLRPCYFGPYRILEKKWPSCL
uniref:Uncharacterized protein n=1 Tax=Nelumbo nucifera TaxID=4432 RepID=A0A822XXV7_NELNU|nr:TPA_asm: hypothetical protein HUJ06_023681 [Nelumbo nucifera]